MYQIGPYRAIILPCLFPCGVPEAAYKGSKWVVKGPGQPDSEGGLARRGQGGVSRRRRLNKLRINNKKQNNTRNTNSWPILIFLFYDMFIKIGLMGWIRIDFALLNTL